MADDEWQTVPERQPRRQHHSQQQQRGGRGRGGYSRGGSNETWRGSRGQPRSTGGAAGDGNWRTPNSSSNNNSSSGTGAGAGAGARRDASASRQQARSRSRGPTAAAAGGPAVSASQSDAAARFALQTSNMFELHVSRGSRARNNAELKEFFETRDDDDDDEDTFDAIDDDDLDLSGYESEDDDESDAAATFPPVPIRIQCPFCAAKEDTAGAEHTGSTAEVAKHLRGAHGLVFKNLDHMALMLQPYLDAWAERLAAGSGAPGTDGSDQADREIRARVQRETLDAVLATQATERRGDAQQPRKCLFCKRVCDNRAELFRHGYREHNFNIGLPDNLVNVDEFLQILESRLRVLQCLYCEKTFTSAAVLRKHMRKKKHFKISSRNRLYDRFYVVNYVEPGKSWEAIECENNADSDASDRNKDHEEAESWADWDDMTDLPAKSLFDDHVALSADDCRTYMRKTYGFDIAAIRRARRLDFYKTVVLVNIIRHATAKHACFACDKAFDDGAQLAAHLKQAGAEHLQPPADDSSVWESPEFLKPAIDADPLLLGLDDTADDEDSAAAAATAADEAESRRILEEHKRAVREKLRLLALDSHRPDATENPDDGAVTANAAS
ncbi:hypothetical protein GGI11_006228 [Coemansia sp. RSA 2049]|nr:hypothetical protein GGI11_006228 [Coemansia sp. RSA 2049]